MLYESELCHNDAEATKKYLLSERWSRSWSEYNTQLVQEISLGCKNVDDQAKSVRPKIVDAGVVLPAIEPNPASSTRGISWEIHIS